LSPNFERKEAISFIEEIIRDRALKQAKKEKALN